MKASQKRAMALALLFDILFGDPPNRFHLVAWMGSLIGWVDRRATSQRPMGDLVAGAGLVFGGGALIIVVARAMERFFSRLSSNLVWLLEAACLKMTFSLRGLRRTAAEVEKSLKAGNLPQARQLVSWHLVSRDTSKLDACGVAAATIESVAENASDGVIAPLFYYLVGGLPFAFAYRFINTADSLLGYHDLKHEWLGKIPARVDDLVNWLPARLTAGLFVLAALLCGENGVGAWQMLKRDASQTQSPNAGYPMSAMAGALGVELEKIGHYRLGAGFPKPVVTDIRRSTRLLSATALLGFFLFPLLHHTNWMKRVIRGKQ